MSDRRRSSRPRAGFTAMEMMIVVGVFALLATMTVPALLGAMRNGRVNEAANAITRVASQARQLARTRYDTTNFYGVVIVNDPAPGYVALTWGPTAAVSTILEEPPSSGKPVTKLTFNRNVLAFIGETPLSTGDASSAWMYQYRTGYPIDPPGSASSTSPPVNILGLSLRTIDGKYKSALAVYKVGVINVQNF